MRNKAKNKQTSNTNPAPSSVNVTQYRRGAPVRSRSRPVKTVNQTNSTQANPYPNALFAHRKARGTGSSSRRVPYIEQLKPKTY